MIRATLLSLVLVLFGACISDECDPTGNWDLVASFGAGDCDITGAEPLRFTVTETQSSFAISSSDPGFSISGSIRGNNDGSCSLSATGTDSDVLGDGGSVTSSTSLNLSADPEGRVVGSGSISLTGPAGTCTQNFSATGQIR